MNESPEEFESELSRLRPRALPEELAARIAAEIDEPVGAARAARRSFADRCLAAFIGAGALAAMVIVGLLVWQALDDSRHGSFQPPPSIVAQQSAPPSIAEYQQALARSNGEALELLR